MLNTSLPVSPKLWILPIFVCVCVLGGGGGGGGGVEGVGGKKHIL